MGQDFEAPGLQGKRLVALGRLPGGLPVLAWASHSSQSSPTSRAFATSCLLGARVASLTGLTEVIFAVAFAWSCWASRWAAGFSQKSDHVRTLTGPAGVGGRAPVRTWESGRRGAKDDVVDDIRGDDERKAAELTCQAARSNRFGVGVRATWTRPDRAA